LQGTPLCLPLFAYENKNDGESLVNIQARFFFFQI
jgi:hypothetical protein